MSAITWKPYGDYLTKSNVRRFMDRHGIATGAELVRRSTADVAWFWDAALADLGLEWYRPYDRIMDDSGGIAWARWFVGGKTNIILNCVDRHVRDGRGSKPALVWEGDDGAVRRWTYAELSAEVSRVANALRALGLRPGDRAGIYMPMVPEIVAAFFGCLKAGVVAVPVFSGFGAEALAARLRDSGARVLFTADGGLRRGKEVAIKPAADEALAAAPAVEHAIVLRRTGAEVAWTRGRDRAWEEIVGGAASEAVTEELDAEAVALVIYTSGTTGKPKGTVHTHAGCLAQMTKELAYNLDVKPDDLMFWVTDIGWMMGPWEMIGVSALGAAFLLFEGAPNWPEPDRLWQTVAHHGVTQLGISPTAVRVLKKEGDAWVDRHPMPSLRLLGSTGEPWDEESYMWFFNKVGGGRCPLINISGGTEIVGCLLAPLPISELKATTLGGPGLGMDVDVYDDDGKPVRGRVGHLVCKQPAPSMTKGFLNDRERYLETYFSRWPGVWYHGDWALVDEDGFWFLHGRADDTIKVAGKRLGPGEVESALISHAAVAEAAAIGVPDELKGEALVCFVVLKPGRTAEEPLRRELIDQVAHVLGKSLKPSDVRFVEALPKTRSAKIVRAAIRRVYLGEAAGDISSVENPDTLEAIKRAT